MTTPLADPRPSQLDPMVVGCPCSGCEKRRVALGMSLLREDPAPAFVFDGFAGRDALFAGAFIEEYRRARQTHGPMNSAHEGYAIILEELDEIKQIVWQKQKNRNYADLRKEVVQLGAMTLAFLVEIVDTENRK